jgi:capsule polysaccharide export protein KpsE/RkpR
MAIIIEEERKRSNFTGLIGWLVIFVVIVVAVYYVFFAAPQLVIITPTDTISSIAPIAQASLSVNTILQDPAFKALNPSLIPPVATTTSGGRPNPFIAP